MLPHQDCDNFVYPTLWETINQNPSSTGGLRAFLIWAGFFLPRLNPTHTTAITKAVSSAAIVLRDNIPKG